MSIPDFREYYYLDDITKKSLGFLESFDELEAVAIMLGFKPSFGIELFQNEYDWFVAPVKQLRKDVENGRLTKSTYTTEQGYGFNDVYVYQVNSLDMKEWASFYGYDWKIPEYKPFKPQQNEFLKSDETLLQNTTNQDQIAELQARIAELEAENQNLKKPEPLGDNYNPTERGTHLQAIAILAIREAERKPTSLMTNTGKIKNSSIADILAKEAKTLFTNPRDKDAFRRRLAEALKTYETQAE